MTASEPSARPEREAFSRRGLGARAVRPAAAQALRRRACRRFKLSLQVLLLALGLPVVGVAEDAAELRAQLDEARRISYQDHWQQAQQILDRLASRIEPSELREYADFHLLEARHLALADHSVRALERVAALLEQDLADDQRLRALQFSANISVLLRQYERAFEYLGEALSIAVDSDDPSPRIDTLNMASYMLGRVGEFGRGIEFGEAAVAQARDREDATELCVSLQRLAPVYKWAEMPEASEQAYRDGMLHCAGVDNRLFVGVLGHGLADLLRRQGRLEEARQLALDAIQELEDAVYPLGEFEARVVLAEIRAELGELTALEDAELAELTDYFGGREIWDQFARVKELRARVAEQLGEPNRAVQLMREYIQAREQFLGRERAMRLAYLQVEFESRFQQQEIDLLRESNRVAKLEARAADQQRQLRTLVIVLVVLSFIALLALLARLYRSRLRFRELSRQDQLSGLANHSWFFERASEVLREHATLENSDVLVLVAADIDHFKRVNDQYGHRVGDGVLGLTARRLRAAFPDRALVGRIGGEEFAVLLRARTLAEVVQSIEILRAGEGLAQRADDPPVTLSFGLSCYRPGDTIQSLRERADRALYQAKQDGRDRYVLDAACRD